MVQVEQDIGHELVPGVGRVDDEGTLFRQAGQELEGEGQEEVLQGMAGLLRSPEGRRAKGCKGLEG